MAPAASTDISSRYLQNLVFINFTLGSSPITKIPMSFVDFIKIIDVTRTA